MPRKPKHPSWSTLSDAERAAYLHDCRRRGGLARAAQESMAVARSRGFWATFEKHPFFAHKWLRHKINGHNQAGADRHNLSPAEFRFRRKQTLYYIYIRLSSGK